ncbi:hypothetical protein TVAG_083220 [Trichomonas vaginalis G3]|uniref:Uncharacterized protein n=1 Tax=Trichomonas vaginalis (strain ATCC PRA-98 / G3) TaxID=412133 RepID=A2DM49_TRIV3|nr:hypothetical protein TVAGG3_0984160 [Trichomonas vaginalis G3]EAY18469.1 hypothetical protein TVAG_083220 [Trichomonas vaginalis G3]KAI5489542.1 hypothetical protein TVAGG3_0984160 [Trichomonas vaginalis G3]|eukprot:XP_001579455.1 hypothetical protein [Trichomonas vaginalis G3]
MSRKVSLLMEQASISLGDSKELGKHIAVNFENIIRNPFNTSVLISIWERLSDKERMI